VITEGRAYRESMVVVTMRGRWTIKRKEKRKEKDGEREGGRRRRRRRRRTAREEIRWSKGLFIYPEPCIPTRNQARCRETNLGGGGWGLDWGMWMNWFTDFAPSGPIYNSILPRVRETPKVDGPNSNLRPHRSSPFTLSSSLGPILSLSFEAEGRQWFEQVAQRKDGS